MNSLGLMAGPDSSEKRTIVKIALVHSGVYAGSSDTIGQLLPSADLLGFPVRKRLLASILRFADELSDDSSRASRYFAVLGEEIPELSRLFHLYSHSLQSVRVKDSEVRLGFDFDEEHALRTYRKRVTSDGVAAIDSERYLLDEIYERTLKMHRERMYCVRFMRPWIDISHIDVRITIYEKLDDISDGRNEKKSLLHPERVNYVLEEVGYPGCPNEHFSAYCSGASDIMTGKELKERFEKRRRAENG